MSMMGSRCSSKLTPSIVPPRSALRPLVEVNCQALQASLRNKSYSLMSELSIFDASAKLLLIVPFFVARFPKSAQKTVRFEWLIARIHAYCTVSSCSTMLPPSIFRGFGTCGMLAEIVLMSAAVLSARSSSSSSSSSELELELPSSSLAS